jgi:transmembrane sensor
MADVKPDHLIVRYLSNEASAEEQEQLFDWISRNQENHKVFNEYINAWSAYPHQVDAVHVAKGLRKLNARIDAVAQHEEQGKLVLFNRWSIAAGILLVVVAGFLLFKSPFFETDKVATVQTVTVQAARIQQVNLPDGSVITLNKNASLQYPEVFNATAREVSVTGEAFFEVAKDSLKPFVIHAQHLTTTVLGTSFSVHATPDQFSVSVATGKVKVSDGKQTEILKPYERIIYRNRGFTKQPTTLAELDWTYRALVFEDANLEEAAKKISKHFEVSVSFKNDALKKCLITGRFKNESLETVLKAIAFSNDVHYVITDSVVELSGKGFN